MVQIFFSDRPMPRVDDSYSCGDLQIGLRVKQNA